MQKIAAAVVAMTSLAYLAAVVAADEKAGQRNLPLWVDKTQTYCMVPVLPETAAKLHVTVNGVWAGIGGSHPLLTHREIVPAVQMKYGTDAAAFVDDSHKARLLVCGIVNGLEGMPALRGQWPQLDDMACRDAAGKPAAVGGNMTLMCTNNPDWLQWEIDFGKRGIDAGADLILLDTPMSAPFISGFLRGGFCRHCLSGFEKYLNAKFTAEELAERFNLVGFDGHTIIARLSPLQNIADPTRRPHHNSTQDDLLFREFIYCQEQASFDSRKVLIDSLRAHSGKHDRQVVFSTNASDLGTCNPAGHWIRGLMFADIFDLFVYEQNVEPTGFPADQVLPYPRGKWLAYHKLAHSVHLRRAPAVIHATAMGKIVQQVLAVGSSFNTWMAVQSAEAYAANGAYVQYYIEPQIGKQALLDKCWASSARHAEFVNSHGDLYAGRLRSGSPLTLLFLLNERGRTIPAVCPSYLGFAQALGEGNYPFDVEFAGDGRYVEDRLTIDRLEPYQVVLVPSPISPTENQKRVVQEFVRAGGSLVCLEPERLGLVGEAGNRRQSAIPSVQDQFNFGKGQVFVVRGTISDTWTDDVGSNYFKAYQPDLRREIGRLAESFGIAPMISGAATDKVSAFPMLQPDLKRMVVHLVNYDINYAKDSIREKMDVVVGVPRAGFLPDAIAARLYAPGDEPESLKLQVEKGRISFTVPRLRVTAAVVVSGE